MIADLRSDTFTKPTPGMLEAMILARVGDDVFEEDPTVIELESKLAALFGFQAALFCPSGTMSNQIAIKCHTEPGNEVICDYLSHVYQYEAGGIAFHSGCQVKTIHGDRGRINAKQVADAINPDDIHKPISSLVCVENTANRGGGSCYELTDLKEIKTVCLQNNLKFHLDGARIFNAIVAKNESPKNYGEIFDSLSICLSKGLGAPIGSVLLGPRTFIKKGRRIRKLMGGGMRQAGYLAAAGLYALENNIQRLTTDHNHSRYIGKCLEVKDFILNMMPIETNIIIFEVQGKYGASAFVQHLQKNNILCIAISPSHVRMVFHLDITEDMIQHISQVIAKM